MNSEHIKALAAEHGRDFALVVNMSGGKDSVRMLGWIREQFPDVTTFVVYADTGFEHIRPVTAEQWSRERAAAFGLPLQVVRNPRKTYLEMVERRGMFPAPKYRQCTSDLKRDPIAKFIRSLPQRVIVNCTGIRAAESASRAKQNPWKLDPRLSKQGRTVYNWMPIFSLTLADVLDWHRATGTPLHPVYVWAGGYLKRFSCRLCIFSTDADIHAIAQHDPEAFQMVSGLEQRMGFTMRPGESLLQVIGQAPADPAQYGEEDAAPPCA